MADHNALGKLGEQIAAEYLKGEGMKILDLNWRLNRNEIDLVGIEGDRLVVAEIKTRNANPFQEPEHAVTREKQRIMVRSGNAYARLKRINKEVRFDIVTIIFTGNDYQVNHIRDAFYPVL